MVRFGLMPLVLLALTVGCSTYHQAGPTFSLEAAQRIRAREGNREIAILSGDLRPRSDGTVPRLVLDKVDANWTSAHDPQTQTPYRFRNASIVQATTKHRTMSTLTGIAGGVGCAVVAYGLADVAEDLASAFAFPAARAPSKAREFATKVAIVTIPVGALIGALIGSKQHYVFWSPL